MAGGVPVDRRCRNEGGLHRVFRRQVLQFGIEFQQLVIIPGAQTLDERVIKFFRARMKTRRRAALQAMAYVAAGHYGDAPVSRRAAPAMASPSSAKPGSPG